MRKGVSIQVEGLEKLKKKLGAIPENVSAEVDAELGAIAQGFANRAAQDAPVGIAGFLKGQISDPPIHAGEMQWEVVSGSSYSAFVEFGTRSKVQIPAGLESYAAQFRGAKVGTDPKEAIFEWCRIKGIPKEAWYPIYIKIMTKGITPHPFFFKQLPIAQAEMKEVNKAVKRALEK